MELFYSRDIEGGICQLDKDESTHCIKVLRHRAGDEISVIDGCGTLYKCRITSDSHKGVEAVVLSTTERWGSHNYHLQMAVCPTKRKILKTPRIEKILISAAKQSLKATVPTIHEPLSVKEFIQSCDKSPDTLRLIAYCFEDEQIPRRSIKEVLNEYSANRIIILIGPEGDFSKAEADTALANGFIPVHLGESRLRTETAALTAAASVYFRYM